MNELTYEEFCSQPFEYRGGYSTDKYALRMRRNDQLGVQVETYTERLVPGDIYGGWKDGEVYYFVDGDPRQFTTSADLYVAWMEKVCGMPRGCGEWKDEE